jgi:hypothetical protein
MHVLSGRIGNRFVEAQESSSAILCLMINCPLAALPGLEKKAGLSDYPSSTKNKIRRRE